MKTLSLVDICPLLEGIGFTSKLAKGSHNIFHKTGVEEVINLQPLGNKAKANKVKRVRNLLLKYQLEID